MEALSKVGKHSRSPKLHNLYERMIGNLNRVKIRSLPSAMLALALIRSTCAFAPSDIARRPPHSYRGRCASSSLHPSTFGPSGKDGPMRLKASLSPAVNVALISSSVAILSGYHINLFRRERNSGTKTWRQYQADTREDWARHVRETEGWLYAIQSLRNAMVAQQFLATTVLSLLTLITGKMWDIIRTASNRWERRLRTVQLASISTTMLFSSYYFIQGVRLMTHAGFMFPVKTCNTKVDNIMRHTEYSQWLGLRWMYLSVAPIAWVVGGSRAFFAIACSLFQFFRSIDKQPEPTRDDICVVDLDVIM